LRNSNNTFLGGFRGGRHLSVIENPFFLKNPIFSEIKIEKNQIFGEKLDYLEKKSDFWGKNQIFWENIRFLPNSDIFKSDLNQIGLFFNISIFFYRTIPNVFHLGGVNNNCGWNCNEFNLYRVEATDKV
jgi:hypothetical protein